MFKCEKSVRQMWTLHGPTETLRLSTSALTQDVCKDLIRLFIIIIYI